MGFRRRGSPSISRWIVGAVFLAVGVLTASAAISWLGSRDEGPATDTAAADSAADRRARIRVEVLNGAGDPGAAERVARWIRDQGFDVVYFGNASHFDEETTYLVDRDQETDGARVLARSLSVDSLAADHQPELYLDATLILGADWRQRFPDAASGRLRRLPGPGSDSVGAGPGGG